MDLMNNDFVIHRAYYDSARDGFCLYIWEPLEGLTGWNGTKSFKVCVTDDDLNNFCVRMMRLCMVILGTLVRQNSRKSKMIITSEI